MMPIRATENYWILETNKLGYALGLNKSGLLTHCYWGAKLHGESDYPLPVTPKDWASFNPTTHLTPEEYPAYAGLRYIEPTLMVTFADGVRDAVLRFDSAKIEGDHLQIIMQDAHYPLVVTLHYRAHEAHDLLERWVSVTNNGTDPITIQRIFSAQWHLPKGDDYWITHLGGRWIDEWNLFHEPLSRGVKVIDSRRLVTSQNSNPFFAIDRGTADEDNGEVWFGTLAWSGNWKLAAEVTDFASTRVNIGLNDFDFAWSLQGGETFTTPTSFAGYTDQGFGAASRTLHDYVRDDLLPHGKTLHKIIYNSWEATMFDVSEPSQIELATIAADLGVELFVMDDGWFNGRNKDNAGLGDWWPDPKKFPNGLKPLVDAVNALGMDFGIWIEPEMVNPDSDLYRTHPDWTIHFPNRIPTEARNQLILNFGRTDVQDYIIAQFDKLLTKNNITFIKWDMNRNVSEPGWPDAERDQRELWVRYVYGLYRVWGTLRERHPNVFWQSCSGGGGRADFGILRLADQVWISDNTDAPTRLSIQEGYSYSFPANTMEAWVTDWSREYVPLEFRFHVSMAGTLGIGTHLLHWNEDQRAEAKRLVELYKEIRHIVQLGDLYRLRSAQKHPYSALQYVSKDKSEGVLFAFRVHQPDVQHIPMLYLCGLDPTARYEVEGCGSARSGDSWMKAGLEIQLGNFQSTIRRIRRV
jgi:alpha-galactosidase